MEVLKCKKLVEAWEVDAVQVEGVVWVVEEGWAGDPAVTVYAQIVVTGYLIREGCLAFR